MKHENALEEVVRELDRRGLKVSEIERVLGCDYTTILRNMPPPGSPEHNLSVPLTDTLSQMELLTNYSLPLLPQRLSLLSRQ